MSRRSRGRAGIEIVKSLLHFTGSKGCYIYTLKYLSITFFRNYIYLRTIYSIIRPPPLDTGSTNLEPSLVPRLDSRKAWVQ